MALLLLLYRSNGSPDPLVAIATNFAPCGPALAEAIAETLGHPPWEVLSVSESILNK